MTGSLRDGQKHRQKDRQTGPMPYTIIHPSKDAWAYITILHHNKIYQRPNYIRPTLFQKTKDPLQTNLQRAMGLPFNQSPKTVQEPCCILNANHGP